MELVEKRYVYRVRRNGVFYERRPDGRWLYRNAADWWEFILVPEFVADLETEFQRMLEKD